MPDEETDPPVAAAGKTPLGSSVRHDQANAVTSASTPGYPATSSLWVKFVLSYLLVPALLLAADDAKSLAKKAQKAEKKGDAANAYLLYSQAVALDPGNSAYWDRSSGLLASALQTLRVSAPETPLPVAVPEPVFDPISDQERIDVMRMLPPKQIKGSAEIKSLNLQGDARSLFEKVAGAYGLRVVFDGDYPSPAGSLRFSLPDADYKTAIRSLEAMTNSFVIPLSETLLLVAKDGTQKRQELEPNAAVLIPYPETITPQELTEAVNAVKSLFDITRIGIDTARRQVYIRDRVSRVSAAQRIVEQLMARRGEVVVDVELLAMSRRSESTYGARLPSSFSLSWLGNTGFLNASTIPTTITGLLTFGGGITMMGLGITNASIFASMTQNTTRSMSKAELRSMDGQPAQVHIGDRYPIITLGYYGGPPDPKLKTYTPPPNIQFEDLGVVVKVTPKVHNSEEVSLDIEAEYKALAGSSANQIPVISNRKFKSVVRLKFGELAVMAGLVSQGISKSAGGIPFLIKLPGLHEQNNTQDDNEILLTLRPFLLTVPPSEGVTAAIWSGSETRPLSLIQ